MKIWIDRDEWYPVYTADTNGSWGKTAEVPGGFLVEYERVMKEFAAMQKVLKDLSGWED